jgi:hypothetical protein
VFGAALFTSVAGSAGAIAGTPGAVFGAFKSVPPPQAVNSNALGNNSDFMVFLIIMNCDLASLTRLLTAEYAVQ